MEDVSQYIEQFVAMIIEYAPKLGLALVVLLIGLRIINKLVDFVTKTMERNGLSEDIRPFLSSIIGVGLKIPPYIPV